MLQNQSEKAHIPHFDYLRSKIFGAAHNSVDASQMEIAVRIRALFPNYADDSLLGQVLDKIPQSSHALQDLETIKKFAALLSPEDFETFSQANGQRASPRSNPAPAPLSEELADRLHSVLEPFTEIFANPDAKIICFWTTRPLIEWESFKGDIIGSDLQTTESLRLELAKACRFGIPGQTIQSIELPELGYRMAFSYNGWKQIRSPCLLFKRLIA